VGRPVGFEGYGNVVLIRSSAHTEELYAHLASFVVHPAERVHSGERIATAGCTGMCTGTHLHFEVRRDGTAVNPLTTVLRSLERGSSTSTRQLTGITRSDAPRPPVIVPSFKPLP
jgi:murein DD-endopeptidase MepM/ murein hydrolase activator NlpD